MTVNERSAEATSTSWTPCDTPPTSRRDVTSTLAGRASSGASRASENPSSCRPASASRRVHRRCSFTGASMGSCEPSRGAGGGLAERRPVRPDAASRRSSSQPNRPVTSSSMGRQSDAPRKPSRRSSTLTRRARGYHRDGTRKTFRWTSADGAALRAGRRSMGPDRWLTGCPGARGGFEDGQQRHPPSRGRRDRAGRRGDGARPRGRRRRGGRPLGARRHLRLGRPRGPRTPPMGAAAVSPGPRARRRRGECRARRGDRSRHPRDGRAHPCVRHLQALPRRRVQPVPVDGVLRVHDAAWRDGRPLRGPGGPADPAAGRPRRPRRRAGRAALDPGSRGPPGWGRPDRARPWRSSGPAPSASSC